MSVRSITGSPLLLALALPIYAAAEEPLTERFSMEGPLRAEPFGAVAAVDSNANNQIDTLLTDVSIAVGDGRVSDGEALLAAFLYWAGSMEQTAAVCGDPIDGSVELTPPGGDPSTVTADACFCADGGGSSFDMYACRADVSTALGSTVVTGNLTVAGISARTSDASIDNASVSLVLVLEDTGWRQLSLLDGIETLSSSSRSLQLSGSTVADPPVGRLGFHVLDGDAGGTGTESVSVQSPMGAALALSDAVNPADNPMNQTISLGGTAQTGTIGLDLDYLPLPEGSLSAGDDSLSALFSAGTDKWWLVWTLVEYEAVEPPPELVFSDGFEGN